jgi:hypothetical protein
MAINVGTLLAWLGTLDEEDEVAIDDGGLTLVQIDGDAYFEVGGIPEDLDEEP